MTFLILPRKQTYLPREFITGVLPTVSYSEWTLLGESVNQPLLTFVKNTGKKSIMTKLSYISSVRCDIQERLIFLKFLFMASFTPFRRIHSFPKSNPSFLVTPDCLKKWIASLYLDFLSQHSLLTTLPTKR